MHIDQIKNEEQLVEALQPLDVSPLWAQMKRLNPPAPSPKTVPFVWDYDTIKPYLEKAGQVVNEKQAERRVLMLVNPTREAPFTTDTLYAGLQLVRPGETASAHRHTAFAVRFIIEGRGGFTAVHGKRIQMRPRDVIVTPTWNFHDHGKKGPGEEGGDDSPVIWLDGLDLPNFMHFPVHFVEHFVEQRYPANDVAESAVLFPWEKMQAKLDDAKTDWASVPYLKEDGRESRFPDLETFRIDQNMSIIPPYNAGSADRLDIVGRVIGASCERLNVGAKSPSIRETASSVYHVIEGSGYTTINEKKFPWRQGATFCIPAWQEYQHFADKREKVYLYRFDDKPMLRALGFYRVDGVDIESLVSD